MPLLKEMKLPVTVKITGSCNAIDSINTEVHKLMIRGMYDGVSIENGDDKIILKSMDTHSTFAHSVFVELDGVCRMSVTYGKAVKVFESDIFEIQFTGTTSGVIIPSGKRGIDALHKNSVGEDIYSLYGHKMELNAFCLYRHSTTAMHFNYVTIERL